MLFEGPGASSRPWSAAASTRRRSALAFVKHHLLRRGGSLSASTLVIALFLPAVCLTASFAGPSQEGGQIPEPRLNQPGKDVQWVPTPPALVEKMLDLAQLTPQDRLVDLGSGDGVLVIAAARRGIRARGIEYDRGLVDYAKRSAREAGLDKQTSFTRGDIFETDFSD